MRRIASLLACLLLLGLPALVVGPQALAKGPKPSNATTSITATSTLSPTPPAAVTSAGSTTSTTTTATAPATSHALPYTGLNIGACIAVGSVLLLAGCTLRRLTRTS